MATPPEVVAQPGCLFCDIITGTRPAHLVLDEADWVAFLDIRPVFPGHVLVVPRTHVDDFDAADPEVVAGLARVGQRVSRAVQQAMGAAGAFIATNVRVSQSVPHLHLHVVPRSRGDGLRGFFWPRSPYADDDEASRVAAGIRDALTARA